MNKMLTSPHYNFKQMLAVFLRHIAQDARRRAEHKKHPYPGCCETIGRIAETMDKFTGYAEGNFPMSEPILAANEIIAAHMMAHGRYNIDETDAITMCGFEYIAHMLSVLSEVSGLVVRIHVANTTSKECLAHVEQSSKEHIMLLVPVVGGGIAISRMLGVVACAKGDILRSCILTRFMMFVSPDDVEGQQFLRDEMTAALDRHRGSTMLPVTKHAYHNMKQFAMNDLMMAMQSNYKHFITSLN
jgi:hypothetical protein